MGSGLESQRDADAHCDAADGHAHQRPEPPRTAQERALDGGFPWRLGIIHEDSASPGPPGPPEPPGPARAAAEVR